MVSEAPARRRLEGGRIPLCSGSPFCEAAAVAAAAAAGASDWVSESGTGANQRGQRTGGARHGEYEEPISSGPEPALAPRLAGLADHSGEAQAPVGPGEPSGASPSAAAGCPGWGPRGDWASGPGLRSPPARDGARERLLGVRALTGRCCRPVVAPTVGPVPGPGVLTRRPRAPSTHARVRAPRPRIGKGGRTPAPAAGPGSPHPVPVRTAPPVR